MMTLLVTLALLLEGSGDTPPQAGISRPDWVRLPTEDEMVAAYPQRALREEVAGATVLRCRVAAEGVLSDCEVASEEPAGMGFGAASLSLAPLFRMKPFTREGQPVEGGTVRIPLHWSLSPD